MTQWNWLDATAAAQALRDGALSAQMLVEACIERVQAVDADVQAWAFFDPEHARSQARALDQQRKEGKPLGALHGLPVGIKDIIDTADMPTEDGTVLHAGRRPSADAAVVAALRSAGAIVFGKTVTTELATYTPGKTRNPHNPRHTPGGSSSGSAAAVASGMVPLALGTQTNGSVIRPAALCGVVGFKPSHGVVPRTGILRQSRALDTVGVMARSVPDAALILQCIAGYDAGDPDSRPSARVDYARIAAEEPPLPPTLAFVRTPVWDRIDAESSAAFDELIAHLGDRVETLELPATLAAAWDWHRTIMEADIAASFVVEYERGAERLSASLRKQIERGRATLAFDYLEALAHVARLNESFAPIYDRVDALVRGEPVRAGELPAHGPARAGARALT